MPKKGVWLTLIVVVVLIIGVLLVYSYSKKDSSDQNKEKIISSFTECVAEGYSIDENSYPKTCRVDGWVFFDGVTEGEEGAREIAATSDCLRYGQLANTNAYYWGNTTTNEATVWIDLIPNEEREGCNPACVFKTDKNTGKITTSEINWRCT